MELAEFNVNVTVKEKRESQAASEHSSVRSETSHNKSIQQFN